MKMKMKMLEGAESCVVSNSSHSNNKRKKMNKEQRRFSDEQIRRLEMMFESERKLEARKKVEVARELGLQPRQVAIWFQNKRARWKSNHIHKEYSLLLSNYNNLSSQFDSLNKENHSLQIQLEKLKKEMSMRRGNIEEWAVEEGGAKNGESKNGMVSVVNSDDDDDNDNDNDMESNIKAEIVLQVREEEEELLRMVDTSDWGGTSLHSDDIIINQTSCQWWDFWS